MFRVFTFLLALTAIISCQSSKKTAVQSLPFTDAELELVSMKIDLKTNFLNEQKITLAFDLEARSYRGKSTCNGYFGALSNVENNVLHFDIGGMTEMMCADDIMFLETCYTNALIGHDFAVTVKKDNVIFTDVANGNVLTFIKVVKN